VTPYIHAEVGGEMDYEWQERSVGGRDMEGGTDPDGPMGIIGSGEGRSKEG
jgi:hypothetical protein